MKRRGKDDKDSNWKKLQQQLESVSSLVKSSASRTTEKRKRSDIKAAVERSKKQKQDDASIVRQKGSRQVRELSAEDKAKYIGLDCEMVGIGSSGKRSVLARACLVNFDGDVVYDKFVRPNEFVTDFRTKFSGVRKENFRRDTAITLAECQKDVAGLLKDKILVGHALKNDLAVLLLSHPRAMIRDTGTYPPYMRPHPKKEGRFKPRALRELTKQFLDYSIQIGEHDPGEDARAAMNLYKHKRDEWEGNLKLKAQEIAKKRKSTQKIRR